MLLVLAIAVGAVTGLATAALWWALAVLARLTPPSDDQAAACMVLGIIGLSIAAGVFMWRN